MGDEPYWYTISSHPYSGTDIQSTHMGDDYPPKGTEWRVRIEGSVVLRTPYKNYAWDVYQASFDISTQGVD